jgi:GTP-binding protein
MIRPPSVVLIGRTNVGKSSIFNRLIEEQKSLVSDVAGTTRDRFEGQCLWRGQVINIVDTGGLDVDKSQEIEKNIVRQAELAMKAADLILFVVDARIDPSADDVSIAQQLAKSHKPVIVVGNKADNSEFRRAITSTAWRNWPLPKPLGISAKQGTGVGDLLDEITTTLIKHGHPPTPIENIKAMRVAVFGEPNVGKSTLLNTVLKEERFITANVPHTTRQPNDVRITYKEKEYLFIDTAGIRRQAARRRSGTTLEKKGVDETLDVLNRCDVALFVLDATKKLTVQDKHLAGVLAEHGVSVVIVVNKWDLIGDKTPTTVNRFTEYLYGTLPQLDYAPILFISALTGQRAHDVFTAIDRVFAARFTQLSDDEARQFMSRAIMHHKPQRGKGVKHPQVVSFVQTKLNPPVFTLKVDLAREDSLNVAYTRFLERLLREHYEFVGTPLRIRILSSARKSHTTY